MHPLIAEFRSLPAAGAKGADTADERKLEIVRALDEDANDDAVSVLLLELLRNSAESARIRAEAVEVVGLYVDESSALWQELFREVLRIHGDATESAAVRAAAEPYAVFFTETLAG